MLIQANEQYGIINRSWNHSLKLFFIRVAPINRAEIIIRTIFCPALLSEFLFGESLGHVQLFGVGHCTVAFSGSIVTESFEIKME